MKTKRIIALMFAVIIVISVFSINGFAVATPLEAGNSMENAANIPEFGVEYVSSLSVAKEVDWFKFTTLSEDAYYTVSFVNYSLSTGHQHYAPNIIVYDANMQTLGWGYDKTNINLKLETGCEYYISVYMGGGASESTGNYSVSVEYKHDEVANEKENATKINVNETKISSFDGTEDIDWFYFEAPVTAEYEIRLSAYNLPSNNNTHNSPNIILFDEYYQVLGSSYVRYGNDAVVKIKLEKGTNCYLNFHMGGGVSDQTGNYEFSVTCFDTITLESISIKSIPSKTTYSVGETFDATGLKILANYSDGTSVDINNNYTVIGFDSSVAGTNTVTVIYSENGVEKSATFDVTIEEASSESFFTKIINAIINFFLSIFSIFSF